MGNNRLVVAALVFSVFAAQLHPGVGAAQGNDAVTDLVVRAGKARSELRYEEAIELLTKAYELYPDPRILFNTAKVYEDSADCTNALRLYVRTSDMATTKPDEFAELQAAVDEALKGFACGEERETFSALLLSYSQSPHPIVAMNIASHYERHGECIKSREMVVRAKDSPLASEQTAAWADATLARLQCPDPSDGAGGGTSTLTYVSYGLGGLGVASLVAALVIDRGTLADIDEFDSSAEPAFKAACPDRASLAADPRCKAAYDRASGLEDDIASGQSATLWALGAGTLLVGAGATLWYLDNYTAAFADDGVSLRLLPMLSEDTVGGLVRVDLD